MVTSGKQWINTTTSTRDLLKSCRECKKTVQAEGKKKLLYRLLAARWTARHYNSNYQRDKQRGISAGMAYSKSTRVWFPFRKVVAITHEKEDFTSVTQPIKQGPCKIARILSKLQKLFTTLFQGRQVPWKGTSENF